MIRLLSVFVLVATTVDAAPRQLSIEQAVSISLEKRPKLAAARALSAEKTARIEFEKSYYWPNAEISGSVTKGLSGSYGKLAIAGLGASPFKKLFGASLNVWWTVWDFGRTSSRVAVARHGAELSKAWEGVTQHAVVLQSSELFVTCLWRQRRVELIEKEVTARSTNLELAQQMAASQLGNEVDVHLAQAELSVARRKQMSRVSDLKRCHVALGASLGVEDTEFQLVSPGATSFEATDLAALVRQGLNDRPEMNVMDARTKAAEADVSRTRAEFLPRIKVTASGGYAHQDENAVNPSNDAYYAVGLGLEIPIFEGGRTVAELSAMNARTERLQHTRNEWAAMIRAQVMDAVDSGQTAAKQRAAALSELEHSKVFVEQARARYSNKLGDFIAVTHAELTEARAGEAVARTTYLLRIAGIRLDYALGKILP